MMNSNYGKVSRDPVGAFPRGFRIKNSVHDAAVFSPFLELCVRQWIGAFAKGQALFTDDNCAFQNESLIHPSEYDKLI